MKKQQLQQQGFQVVYQHVPFLFEPRSILTKGLRKSYTETVCRDNRLGFYYLAVRIQEESINKILIFEKSISDSYKEFEKKNINTELACRIYLN